VAAQLAAEWGGMVNGAGGMAIYGVDIKNTSDRRCRTGGYFGVSAYDPGGDRITANDDRVTVFGAAHAVTVAAGGTIGFEIGLYDTNGAESCGTTVGALHLIPPNDVHSIQVATPVPRGYAPLCQHTIIVGAIQARAVNHQKDRGTCSVIPAAT
jgi:Protein of unknown function (DUF4232)